MSGTAGRGPDSPVEPLDEQVAGRTALVTGAGNGLGRAIAHALCDRGARVILTGRGRDKLDTVAAEIETASSRRPSRHGRHGLAPSRAQLFAEVVDEQVSILINNAGVAGPVASLWDIEPADWDEVFGFNVRGLCLMCRAVLPPMIDRRAGDVVNVASVSGKRPLARRTPYAASKMAVIGLTTTRAHEVGPLGIRVNTVSPGPVAGPRMTRNFVEAERTGSTEAEAEAEFVGRSALQRMVTEGKVARAVLGVLDMPGLTDADIDLSAGMIAR